MRSMTTRLRTAATLAKATTQERAGGVPAGLRKSSTLDNRKCSSTRAPTARQSSRSRLALTAREVFAPRARSQYPAKCNSARSSGTLMGHKNETRTMGQKALCSPNKKPLVFHGGKLHTMGGIHDRNSHRFQAGELVGKGQTRQNMVG